MKRTSLPLLGWMAPLRHLADPVPDMDQARARRFRTIQDRPKDLQVASC